MHEFEYVCGLGAGRGSFVMGSQTGPHAGCMPQVCTHVNMMHHMFCTICSWSQCLLLRPLSKLD